jgi:hypothetical protein
VSSSDEEMIRRTRRELIDSYDEELELELEDRAQAVDKKKARLNCIHHLLDQMPYREVEHPTIVLPTRERHEDYVRHPVPANMMVPEVY